MAEIMPAKDTLIPAPVLASATRSSTIGERRRPAVETPVRAIVKLRPPVTASYKYDKDARRLIVTLLRPDTGEIVAQIPPEKVLAVGRAIMNTAIHALDANA